jgi:Na+/H+ antiporter NhaD/arsenite permease-like protein
MEGFAVVVGIIVGLSLTVTKIVDFVRNLPWFKNADGTPKFVGSWIWNALAFVVGIVLCVGWQHSFVNDLAHVVPALSTVNFAGNMGYVLSGLILGGLSGFGHELLAALSASARKNNAVALEVALTTGTTSMP